MTLFQKPEVTILKASSDADWKICGMFELSEL